MKVSIIGSRTITLDVSPYVPAGCTTIISGGAKGVDTCAADFARARGLKLVEILPNYDQHGRSAPLRRNTEIIDRADLVLAFWDGHSRGTKDGIDKASARGKPIRVFLCTNGFVTSEM
jgi:hypothetical protein